MLIRIKTRAHITHHFRYLGTHIPKTVSARLEAIFFYIETEKTAVAQTMKWKESCQNRSFSIKSDINKFLGMNSTFEVWKANDADCRLLELIDTELGRKH